MKKVCSVLLLTLTAGLPFSFLNNELQASPVAHEIRIDNVEGFSTSINFNAIKSISNIDGSNNWVLPGILKEVSGIKYLGDDRFACIQDKMGTIFIYNTATSEIEKEIPFGGTGSFEGIAIAGNAAYVVQSDGKIFEVMNYQEAKPTINQYTTPLTAKHKVEGLTFDKNHNRLLLTLKGDELGNNKYKGVYAFDLQSKRLVNAPVVKISINDPFIKDMKEKNGRTTFQPSAIEIHPKTNDIYILQSNNPKLLVLDATGRIKKMYTFERSEFSQAEGLAFSPDGDLFISNEGKDGAASILKVTL